MDSNGSTSPARADADGAPVFGFVLFGGPLSGAMVRDVRLANELAQRGYRVHVWWAMERSERVTLDPRIVQHWLFHGLRYFTLPYCGDLARGAREQVGRLTTVLFHEKNRTQMVQKRSWMLDRLMTRMMKLVCAGVEQDAPVVRRFAAQLEAAGVTHVLPMLAVLGPWVSAAQKHMRRPPRCLITFQGYELYSNYARHAGLGEALYQRLRQAVEQSDYPAIAVSDDYRQRVIDEIGVAPDWLVAIPPGVPAASPEWTRESARAWLGQNLRGRRADLPLVSFVGRQDSEKGIDLLLYAATILRTRGLDVQLAICGPTLFGGEYGRVCRQIAENLRCPVLWKHYISEQMRGALFAGSDCVVYPSIHREPFGMVAAEVMAHGTPVLVPAYGGVADVVEANGACGGLRFGVWDSGDLADQLARLLQDRALWQQLADDGPRAAEYFSIPRLADRVLAHLQLAADAPDTAQPAPSNAG